MPERAEDNVQGLQQGVELVYKQLRDVLEKFGITVLCSRGANPSILQSMTP